jgi:hypothetical protein
MDPTNQAQHLDPLMPNNFDLDNIALSPIRVCKLNQLLANYPLCLVALELLKGFTSGFKLCYDGPRVATECQNLKSMAGLFYEATQLVRKEISLGRVAGPFDYPPPSAESSLVSIRYGTKEGGFLLINSPFIPSLRN